MLRFTLALFLFGLVTCDHSKTNQWPNRSTIVHLFEWKWKDVAEECERFLAPKGYGAVQISPPSENLIIRNNGNRPWYERYQVMSYQLVTRSGGEEELLDMTRRCNKVGVRIYADVVINHMTGNAAAGSVGTGGSTADFDHYHYPAVPYVADNFHTPHCDINDYQNVSEVRKCQLVSLKDLNQSQEVVRNHIVKYLNHLIKLGVTGFRVDASKHMDPRDLREIYSRLDNITDLGVGRRPYVYQEVIYYGGEPIRPDEYTPLGDVTEFRVGNELKNVFRGHNAMKWLRNWGEEWGLSPSGTALAFIDNHDTQRTSDVLTYKEARAYKAAVAFMLAHPYGTPRVMSSYHFDNHEAGPPSQNEEILSPTIHPDGTCGNGWVCEHRWRQLYQMVGFRNAVGSAPVSHWWDNGSKQIAFARENRAFIVFNGELGVDLNVSLKTSLPQGVYCDVISGENKDGGCTGKTISVNKYSDAHFYVPKDAEDMHIAIHVGAESKLY
ncbi:alpha-amylase-like [Aricia agestis]|uniref:alpha-amylase-like n=1 Tax=Aricia agestis TaxID=91739 RepID=UPI001C205468|nr:alpha-amylase-like [Aricia agestis]